MWNGLNPPSQPPKNISIVELKEVYNVAQLIEMIHIALASLEECIDSVKDLNDDVNILKSVALFHVVYNDNFTNASLEENHLVSMKAK